MRKKTNVNINAISWLSKIYKSEGKCIIDNYYEPESVEELIALCSFLYKDKEAFDIVGHTSNLYFSPEYTIKHLITTRRLRHYELLDNLIVCDCGVPVSVLAKDMCNKGIKGFEGLIDLPGTVAAAVYGNASCYNSSISSLLVDLDYLNPQGEIIKINATNCDFSRRSSAFKNGCIKGIILRLRLKRENGDLGEIMKSAQNFHSIRKQTQPGPRNNIGSIHGYSGQSTLLFKVVNFLSNVCVTPFLIVLGKQNKNYYKTKIILTIIGRRDLIPYLFNFNRFIFKDENSHIKFMEYLALYKKFFPNSKIEIEIKK